MSVPSGNSVIRFPLQHPGGGRVRGGRGGILTATKGSPPGTGVMPEKRMTPNDSSVPYLTNLSDRLSSALADIREQRRSECVTRLLLASSITLVAMSDLVCPLSVCSGSCFQ